MTTKSSRLAILSLSLILVSDSDVLAQSGTRQPAPSRPRQLTRAAPLALKGYCPVSVMETKKWARGKREHFVVYDGHKYLFAGEEQKRMFEANPAKYTPALHGDCMVCGVEMQKRVPGSVNFGQFYKDRLYLFPSEAQRKMFRENPTRYADADLAFGGKCAVCRVEMQQDVPGKPEFTTHYQGLRYLFPSAEQKKMFLANPSKYAVRSAAQPNEGSGPSASAHPADSRSSTIRTVSVRGTTGKDE